MSIPTPPPAPSSDRPYLLFLKYGNSGHQINFITRIDGHQPSFKFVIQDMFYQQQVDKGPGAVITNLASMVPLMNDAEQRPAWMTILFNNMDRVATKKWEQLRYDLGYGSAHIEGPKT